MKVKRDVCAPGVTASVAGSCYSAKQLIKIASAWNEHAMQRAARGDDVGFGKITLSKDPKDLLDQLQVRLQPKCGFSRKCWTEQDFVRRLNDVDISKFTFRPDGPQGRNDWLSTAHIDDVLRQYQKKHPDFEYLGAVPSDYENLRFLGLADLNFRELQRGGKTKLGIVFNTDEHYKPGQHWVASYIDLEKRQAYFFDSTGQLPDKRFVNHLARGVRYMIQKGGGGVKDIDIRYNNVVHQRGGSECGPYCVNFIVRMLGGESFDEIIHRKMTDEEVNQCRKTYFNNAVFD